MKSLVYPSNLLNAGTPFISFTAQKFKYGKGGKPLGYCSLYHPANVAFQDGAGYTTFDMGPIGSQIIKGIGSGSTEASLLSAVENTSKAVTSNNDVKTMMALKIAKEGGLTAGNDLASTYGLAKGIVTNPNTTAAFTNMAIRSYVFTFKLIADSKEESKEIKEIQQFFRHNMYPEPGAANYILSYPAKWDIRLYTSQGTENIYYPKIHECFLTSFSTNFNASSHLHYATGAPVEVDISLTFQETKVLNKNEIINGENLYA